MLTRRPKPTYAGVKFDSSEEIQLYQWCEEAVSSGVLREFIYQHPKWTLADAVHKVWYDEKGRTRTKLLLRECSYTPDFQFVFTEVAMAEKCGFDNVVEYIDVKPSFERQHSRAAKFKVLQKWVHAVKGELVHPVIPADLFARTWTPQLALISPTGKVRTGRIAENARTVWEFLEQSK